MLLNPEEEIQLFINIIKSVSVITYITFQYETNLTHSVHMGPKNFQLLKD